MSHETPLLVCCGALQDIPNSRCGVESRRLWRRQQYHGILPRVIRRKAGSAYIELLQNPMRGIHRIYSLLSGRGSALADDAPLQTFLPTRCEHLLLLVCLDRLFDLSRSSCARGSPDKELPTCERLKHCLTGHSHCMQSPVLRLGPSVY